MGLIEGSHSQIVVTQESLHGSNVVWLVDLGARLLNIFPKALRLGAHEILISVGVYVPILNQLRELSHVLGLRLMIAVVELHLQLHVLVVVLEALELDCVAVRADLELRVEHLQVVEGELGELLLSRDRGQLEEVPRLVEKLVREPLTLQLRLIFLLLRPSLNILLSHTRGWA